MRKSILLICAALLFASVAAATDWSTMETFLGYNFVRFNPNSGYAPSFNANGGNGQFVYNLTPWIGGVIDAGAVTNGTLNHFNVDTTVMNFVAGPRFTLHNHSRFSPYAQALFGGAYSTTSTQVTVLPSTGTVFPPGIIVNPNEPLSTRLTASNVGFAMIVGGGLDIKMSKHVAFRPVEASYYLTRIPSLLTGNITNRNNFRYAAGLNFLFGAK